MTTLELDGQAVAAATRAWASLKPWSDAATDEDIVMEVVRAYLAEALRLRPTSEAPEGLSILWQSTYGFVNEGYRLGNKIIINGNTEFEIYNVRGWLPLPQPVEPQP